MAWKNFGGFAQKRAFAIAVALGVAAPLSVGGGPVLHAEEAAAPLTAGPPPLSPQCVVPAADIASAVELKNFATVLEKQGPVRILAIGSSSTAGTGSSSSTKTYPSQLEGVLKRALPGAEVVVINRGLPGEVAANTALRIRTEVARAKPDLVLWQLGTNDALSRVPPKEFEATADSTIRWLKSNQIDVVLVGLQYTPRLAHDPNYAAIRDALQLVAVRENVLYVSRYDAMRFMAQSRADLDLMSHDNFHLNDLGYQCMAEHVAHAVIVGVSMKKFAGHAELK
jgi:lysophospholipase L1-like esterase